MNNYIEDANRTKSDKFYGDKVGLEELRTAVSDAVIFLFKLDVIKKALFYGKGEDTRHTPTAQLIKTHSQIDIDLLHGILGCATEAGEMLEALYVALMNDVPLDLVNLGEEIFDTQWYHAIMCKKLGITFEEGQQKNIAKLRARFPEKFTEEKAINRDLDAERQILEGK